MRSKFQIKTTTLISLLGIIGCSGLTTIASAQKTNLVSFSIEELMKMEITSVSKKRQQLTDAPAAIHVITSQDIHNSGLTSIPELLRLVPGLQVAQINSSKWAISARGFNNRWGNKLLVLMDGRTLYTPIFSGVYWDVQDTNIEDIDRIEVIKGPGSALWGANAVNGVINIITKSSQDTQGALLITESGNTHTNGTVRYGGTIGDTINYRAYIKSTHNNALKKALNNESYDGWNTERFGFRTDWTLAKNENFTFQGDIYQGRINQESGFVKDIYTPATFVREIAKRDGHNLFVRWQQETEDSGMKFQAYADYTLRKSFSLTEKVWTRDLDFQHRFSLDERQEITWGINYRQFEDRLNGSFTVNFQPNKKTINLFGAFIQDEINFDALTIIIGSKIEHNDITHIELQPNLRMHYRFNDKNAFWGALSRAVRTPSRSNTDIRINATTFSSPYIDPDGPSGPLVAGDPTLLSIIGSEKIKSEALVALEAGYKGQLTETLALDITSFYNKYNNLIANSKSFSLEGTPLPTHAVIFSQELNIMDGTSYGIEFQSTWQAQESLIISGGYTWLNSNMNLPENSSDNNSILDIEKGNPKQQIQIRLNWQLNDNLTLNLNSYYVGEIKVRGVEGRIDIPSYTRVDLNVSWQYSKNINLMLAGQNLLTSKHPEFVTTDILPSEVLRAIYGKIKVSF